MPALLGEELVPDVVLVGVGDVHHGQQEGPGRGGDHVLELAAVPEVVEDDAHRLERPLRLEAVLLAPLGDVVEHVLRHPPADAVQEAGVRVQGPVP